MMFGVLVVSLIVGIPAMLGIRDFRKYPDVKRYHS